MNLPTFKDKALNKWAKRYIELVDQKENKDEVERYLRSYQKDLRDVCQKGMEFIKKDIWTPHLNKKAGMYGELVESREGAIEQLKEYMRRPPEQWVLMKRKKDNEVVRMVSIDNPSDLEAVIKWTMDYDPSLSSCVVPIEPPDAHHDHYEKDLSRQNGDLINKQKIPSDKSVHVGIELEFGDWYKRDEVYKKVSPMLVEAGYDKNVWLHYDSGVEASILVKDEDIRCGDTLKNIVGMCKKAGKTCNPENQSLHIHLDMRNRHKERAFHNLVMCQIFLSRFLPKDRLMFEYQAESENAFHHTPHIDVQAGFFGGRQGIATSTKGTRTIEVRLHGATFNYDEIQSWIYILSAIVDTPSLIPEVVALPAHALEHIKGIDSEWFGFYRGTKYI